MNSRVPVVLLTAFVTFLLTSALWVGGGVLCYRKIMEDPGFLDFNDPPGFAIETDAPERVQVGEEFGLGVTVSNPTDGGLTLGSIDFYDELLDGFEVVEASPAADDEMSMPGFHTYYYERSLEPGDEFHVELKLRALTEGTWSGDIDACTPEENFETVVPTIMVEPTS